MLSSKPYTMVSLAGLTALFFLSVGFGKPAKASEIVQQNSSFIEQLSLISHPTPLSGAGSHGSLGLHMGAGLTEPRMANNAAMAKGVGKDQNEALRIQKILMTKGTPFPIDFHMAFGQVMETHVSLVQFMVQWTVYEALSMPAIAIRGSRSVLFGVRSTAFAANALSAVISQGFLRYFDVYLGVGLSDVVSRIGSLDDRATNESVTVSSKKTRIQRQESSAMFGFNVTLFPPYVDSGFELVSTASKVTSLSAKIGVRL